MWASSAAAIEGGCSGAGGGSSFDHGARMLGGRGDDLDRIEGVVPGGGRRGCGAGGVPVWVVAGGPTLGTIRLSTRSASFTVPRTFHEKPSGAIFR